jgi:DNA-binding XRE family transcriptional regulator
MVINFYAELNSTINEESFGDKIRKQRILKNFSQYQLAEKTGLSRSTIYDYERNAVPHSPISLLTIANILNKPIENFDNSDYCNFILSDFPSKIKNWRRRNNINLIMASKLLGLDSRTIRNWKRGITIIDKHSFEILNQYINK